VAGEEKVLASLEVNGDANPNADDDEPEEGTELLNPVSPLHPLFNPPCRCAFSICSLPLQPENQVFACLKDDFTITVQVR
ncbi:MAG: hypothetical protein DFNUSKGM_001042, partial [Candidatus Fervidibacter sacchari]